MDFPFKSVPRFNNNSSQSVQRSEVTHTGYQTPQNDQETLLLKNYMRIALRYTDQAFQPPISFNCASVRSVTAEKKRTAFSAPLPHTIKSAERQYEWVATIPDNAKNPVQYSKVRDILNKGVYLAKFQQRRRASKPHEAALDMIRERDFLAAVTHRLPKDTQISKLRDIAFDDDFKILIVDEAGRDLLYFMNNYKPFDASTTFLLTYFTLQAVKELHSMDYLHLDLRPTSFYVNVPFQVKLMDFFRVTSARPRQKFGALRPDRFTSRASHAKENTADEWSDIESWLYTMMFTTCDGQLPWGHEKEGMKEAKEDFFKNEGGKVNWYGSCDMLCLVPYLIRNEKLNLPKFHEKVSELMSIEAMVYDEMDTPMWSLNALDVQPRRSRNSAAVKSKGEEEKSVETTVYNEPKTRNSVKRKAKKRL